MKLAAARVRMLLAMLVVIATAGAACAEEPPVFAADVAAGNLPPLAQRLPRVPLVVKPDRAGWSPGRYGGTLRTLMAKDRDIRMMVVYGYARLVGLRRAAQDRARHPRADRQRRRQGVHAAPAPRAQVVRRQAVHVGRLPLLLGRRRQQPRTVAVRPAAGAEGRQPRAALRGARRAHGALHVGRAQPAVPAGARGTQPAVHLPARALPAQVPRAIRRSRQGERGGRRRGVAQLGGAAPETRRAVPLRQPRPADAGAVDQHDAAAVDALRAGAQPLFPSRRSGGAAAPVHRPRDRQHHRRQADPGEDRRRRLGPAGALPALRRLHVPQAGGGAQPLSRAPVGEVAGLAARALPEPQRRRSRVAAADARRALSPCAVAGGQPPRDQRSRLFRAGQGIGQHGAGAQPAVPPGIPRRVEPVRRRRREPAARLAGTVEARRERPAAAARRAPDGDHRRHVRREHRGDRRAGAGARQLEPRRHRAFPATVAARGLPQARVFREVDDVDLVGAQQRHPDAGDEPGRARADIAGTAAVAEVGPVLPERRRGRGAGAARGARAARALRAVARRHRRRRRARRSGCGCSPSTRSRCSRSASCRVRRSRSSSPTSCATCLAEGVYSWDPGAYFGMYHPDTFWIDDKEAP